MLIMLYVYCITGHTAIDDSNNEMFVLLPHGTIVIHYDEVTDNNSTIIFTSHNLCHSQSLGNPVTLTRHPCHVSDGQLPTWHVEPFKRLEMDSPSTILVPAHGRLHNN